MASWQLRSEDVSDLAAGCGLLGSGGGGDTHALATVLRSLLEERGGITVLDPAELPADALVVNVGFVGAPVTMHEKLFTRSEIVAAVETMQRRLGRPITALMSTEIGGGNGLAPFIAGALLGYPVVDADGMGRAFPLSDHVSYAIYGRSALPSIAAGEQGEVVVVEAGTNAQAERLVRAVCVVMGSKCFAADHPLTGEDVRECAVLGTVTLARSMGAVIREARRHHRDPLEALCQLLRVNHGVALRVLFEGKVVGVEYNTRGGWGVGQVSLARPREDRPSMVVEFQNEFLIARLNGVPCATTPDIISLCDADTLANVPSDSVRYGQRIKVVGIESPRLMCSERALSVVGPRAFGYELDYRSIAFLPQDFSQGAPAADKVLS